MKSNSHIFIRILVVISILSGHSNAMANKQDSVYLFAYSVNEGKSGLTLAWSLDQKDWHPIGPEHCFLFSDFGAWGTQKRMFSPFLYKDKTGLWHCLWTLNKDVAQFAHAASENLFEWKRQSYPVVMSGGNVLDLEVQETEGGLKISWLCDAGSKQGVYMNSTRDFKQYSTSVKTSENERLNRRKKIEINGTIHRGVINKVSWELVAGLVKHEEWMQFYNGEKSEVMADDPVRFRELRPLYASIRPNQTLSKKISDMLIGVFFEDINYAADGGLYAELVQNRGFEYQPYEKRFSDPSWTAKKAWNITGDATFEIDTVQPVHLNNKHYAAIEIKSNGAMLFNEGWEGIPVQKEMKYDISLFGRMHEPVKGILRVQLVDEKAKIIGETRMNMIPGQWEKYGSVITANSTCINTKLRIVPEFKGKIDLDMISLFPQHTFNNRKNGMREDLAQLIADINPKFVRFPGGCVAHGDGIDNMYRWENTIGPLEARVPQKNIWGYHQSAGLGYYEYFQFCEDIGAEPIPVVPAGVPCQNSSTGGHGQQCGIALDKMDEYTQSVLDLIEWANGDINSEWGRKRSEAGHPEPFNLKYIGIGNEDLISDVFEERFTMIYNAVREKYPEIIVIGTVGPFNMGTDYSEGWDLARKLDLPMVDEHYYESPGWFINNQDFYDSYDRKATKVYLGEYAAHVEGRRRNMETALSEALYLTAIEKNGDVVRMTSYAPLIAKAGYENWNPNLIYFTNTDVTPSVDYYVQQLYGHHTGDQYIPTSVKLSNEEQKVKRRFGVSMVKDDKNGDLIIKLANLLPVEITTKIDLEDFSIEEEGRLIILQGAPQNEIARPVEKKIQVGSALDYKVPKYSLSVIRLELR